jgi:hypothetical protein
VLLKISWEISIVHEDKETKADYSLGFLESVEIHKSVDVLADTCTIKLPVQLYNKAIPQTRADELGNDISGLIAVGDAIKVFIGYDMPDFSNVPAEFEGFLQAINTDDGSIVLTCEDYLYLMRISVADKQFKNTSIKTIAQYLLSQVKADMVINCSLTINYEKFVISKATAYDVLKKIQEETKGNIYIRKNANGQWELNIHPPYVEKHGYVEYSYQENIEKSELKYKRESDRKLEITIERTGKDGKTIKQTFGKTGGDKETIKGNGMDETSLLQLAQNRYHQVCFDGFEGSLTAWLVPYVEPGYSAHITDEDYDYKDGSYYVTAVTTTVDGSGGGVRKVQLGIKLS